MPRRTYDPRNGRRRPYAGTGADWAKTLLQLIERDRRYRPTNARTTYS